MLAATETNMLVVQSLSVEPFKPPVGNSGSGYMPQDI